MFKKSHVTVISPLLCKGHPRKIAKTRARLVKAWLPWAWAFAGIPIIPINTDFWPRRAPCGGTAGGTPSASYRYHFLWKHPPKQIEYAAAHFHWASLALIGGHWGSLGTAGIAGMAPPICLSDPVPGLGELGLSLGYRWQLYFWIAFQNPFHCSLAAAVLYTWAVHGIDGKHRS